MTAQHIAVVDDETAITDAALEKLAARAGLRVINVRKTGVSKELVEKIVEARKEAPVKLSVYN